jgi:hypothetical protein
VFKLPPLAHAAAVIVDVDTLYSSEFEVIPGAIKPPKAKAADVVPALPNSALAVPKVAEDVVQEEPS